MENRNKDYYYLWKTWFYIYETQKTPHKILQIINEYSEILGLKINTEESAVFVYTKNELA